MDKATIISLIVVFILLIVIIIVLIFLFFRNTKSIEYQIITARDKLLVGNIDVGSSIIQLQARGSPVPVGGPMLYPIQFKYSVTVVSGRSNIKYYVYPSPAINTITTIGSAISISVAPSLRFYNFGIITYLGFKAEYSDTQFQVFKIDNTGEVNTNVSWQPQNNPDLITTGSTIYFPVWTRDA